MLIAAQIALIVNIERVGLFIRVQGPFLRYLVQIGLNLELTKRVDRRQRARSVMHALRHSARQIPIRPDRPHMSLIKHLFLQLIEVDRFALEHFRLVL